MAIRDDVPKLTEAELNSPDLDEDGEIDVETYMLPDSEGITDPAFKAAWDEMLRIRERREAGEDEDYDDDEDVDSV